MKRTLRKVVGNEHETQESSRWNEGADSEPKVPEGVVVAESRMSGRLKIWYSGDVLS